MSDELELQKTYYNNRFGSQSQKLNEEESARATHINEALKKISLPENALIADFGCGRGWLSNILSRHGKVTGFDLSEHATQNARSNFPQCEFVTLNATGEIPHQFREYFDLVVSSEVIEHIEDQKQYLSNTRSILKKNGRLLLTTPNGRWKEIFYAGRESWKQPLENWREPLELRELIQKEIFEVNSSESFNAQWIFDLRPPQLLHKLSHPIIRKALKAIGLFSAVIFLLNKKHYGINQLIVATKK